MRRFVVPFFLGVLISSFGWWVYLSFQAIENSESWVAKTSMWSIADFSENWDSAYKNGDFDAMADMYEPDAWLMRQDKSALKGRREILNYFRESQKNGVQVFIADEVEGRTFHQDYVFQIAKWRERIPQDSGEFKRDVGRSMTVFKRGKDKKWRIWRDIDNQTPDVTIGDLR